MDEQHVRLASAAGFTCDACKLSFKDSMSYIDHSHSARHLETTNRSTKVRTATLEDVRERIDKLAEERGLKSKR